MTFFLPEKAHCMSVHEFHSNLENSLDKRMWKQSAVPPEYMGLSGHGAPKNPLIYHHLTH